jgi:hypothetical protein
MTSSSVAEQLSAVLALVRAYRGPHLQGALLLTVRPPLLADMRVNELPANAPQGASTRTHVRTSFARVEPQRGPPWRSQELREGFQQLQAAVEPALDLEPRVAEALTAVPSARLSAFLQVNRILLCLGVVPQPSP